MGWRLQLSIVIPFEDKITKRVSITNQLSNGVKAVSGIQINHKRVEQSNNQTILGRFEPERFSDAMDNLPAVHDAVLDEIIYEMEVEGMNN